MTYDLVLLALLMAAVTYPLRALPLLAPGIERLPRPLREYLRLVGPATLAALAAVSALVVRDASGTAALRLGIEPVAVLLSVAVVAWRRNLFLGIAVAVVLVALVRLAA